MEKVYPSPSIFYFKVQMKFACSSCGNMAYGVSEMKISETTGKLCFAKVPASRRKPYLVHCRCGASIAVYPGEIRFYERDK